MRYNGRDFSDFGVHVDESKAFGSPEKDYELIEVVGRNGNLSIYNDRFKDIVLSFPCFIRSGFIEKYRNLLAYLNSVDGYQRLETEKEPNHFRKALFTGSVDVQTTPWNQGGFFTINFSALPQRFLKTGENWTTVSSSSSEISGNPVSISNPSGLTALTGLNVDIEPVQDFNGYDSPWPAGGWKNLLTPKSNSTITSNGVTFTFNSDETIKITGTPTAKYSYGGVYGVNTVNVSQLHPLLTGLSAGGKMSLTIEGNTTGIGLIAQFNKSDGTLAGSRFTESQLATTVFPDAEYMFVAVRVDRDAVTTPIDCTVNLQITNSDVAESWTPYSNICPITGHTSATVTRTGKNLLPPFVANASWESGNATVVGTGDGAYKFNGTTTGYQQSVIQSDIHLKAGTYTFGVTVEASGTPVSIGLQLRNVRGGITYATAYWTSPSQTFTLAEDTAVRIRFVVQSALTFNNVIIKPQIEYGSEATEFEPYTVNTYTIDLNGTVYGGTLDVSTGVLTVDRAINVIDGTTSLAHNGILSYGGVQIKIVPSPAKATGESNVISDKFANQVPSSDAGFIAGRPTNGYVYFNMPADVTTVQEATAWFTANPTQVVYELAEPQTIQLTPQEVSLLTGTNIISTDMNSLTVTISNPAELENPTLFESKPLIRVYGNGTLNVNDIYITVANSPYTYIDIDCELMDCYHGSNNANQYVSFSTTDYVTLRSGMNYFAYSGFTKVEVTPRWFEV